MPYIITTRPTKCSEFRQLDYIAARGSASAIAHLERADGVTRTAVATLDEAREAIVAAVAGTSRRQSVLDDARWTYADTLPEFGGTIGPLADGTVIQVRLVEWPALADAAAYGDPSPGRALGTGLVPALGAILDAAQAAIIDAFNARS